MKDLIAVGVADPGYHLLVGDDGLDPAAVLRQQASQLLKIQRRRVRAEGGDARHLRGVVHQPDGKTFLGSGLGEIESRAVVEVHPQGDRTLAGFEWGGAEFFRPAQPPGAREMGDQVEITGLQTQILTPALRSGHSAAVQCRQGWIEGLEHRQRGDVDALHRLTDRMPAQMVGERLDFRKLRHAPRRGTAPRTPSRRSRAGSPPRWPSTRTCRWPIPSAWCSR